MDTNISQEKTHTPWVLTSHLTFWQESSSPQHLTWLVDTDRCREIQTKNSLYITLWSLPVPCIPLWALQCTSDISKTHEHFPHWSHLQNVQCIWITLLLLPPPFSNTWLIWRRHSKDSTTGLSLKFKKCQFCLNKLTSLAITSLCNESASSSALQDIIAIFFRTMHAMQFFTGMTISRIHGCFEKAWVSTCLNTFLFRTLLFHSCWCLWP